MPNLIELAELIKPALDAAHELLSRQAEEEPHTVTKYVCIEDIKPADLVAFMQKEGIPDAAHITTHDMSEQKIHYQFGHDDVRACLEWEVTDELDRYKRIAKYKKDNFRRIGLRFVEERLLAYGYTGADNCGKSIRYAFLMNGRNINGQNLYDMYMAGQWVEIARVLASYCIKKEDKTT